MSKANETPCVRVGIGEYWRYIFFTGRWYAFGACTGIEDVRTSDRPLSIAWAMLKLWWHGCDHVEAVQFGPTAPDDRPLP